MAEDTANKEKPKATLIKHSKEPAVIPSVEKKKVVVVKKKKIVKKVVVAKNDEAAKPVKDKPAVEKVVTKSTSIDDSGADKKAAVEAKNIKKADAVKSPAKSSTSKKSVSVDDTSKIVKSAKAKPVDAVVKSVDSNEKMKPSVKKEASTVKADKPAAKKTAAPTLKNTVGAAGAKVSKVTKVSDVKIAEAPVKKASSTTKANDVASTRNFADNIKSSIAFNQRRKEAQEKRKAEGNTGGTRHFRAKPGAPAAGNTYESRGPRPAGSGFPARTGVSRLATGKPGGPGPGRPSFNRDQRPSFNRPNPGGFRPSGPGGPRGPGGPPRGGFRGPGGPNRGAPGRGGPTTPPPTTGREEGKKQHNKRFYKSKKKDYQKNREAEKNFQLSKKKMPKINPVPKEIDILEVITVSDLARKMNLKAADLIGKLLGMGMMATINQQIDSDTATLLADEFGCKVNLVSLYDETLIETEDDGDDSLQLRPPIITVMGHVDHGKTKLLDVIRESNVVAGEHGGITQHIGAYKVVKDGKELVFLDTPGHAAFTLMRARGAQVTDMIILVIAANDGIMPQTVEAINHAKDAGVPIIVAVNKCDLPEANVDRVKQQLSEHELIPEDWGGSTLFCEISALKNEGIDHLLEVIALQTEMMELKANFDTRAEGKVIESRVEQGRGIVSTIIVQRGTLRTGDAYVAGVFYGKVRAMFNDHGENIKEAGPSTPVEIIGLTGIPDAGSPFQVTETEKEAKQVASKRQELGKQSEAKNVKKITLDNLYDTIHDAEVQELKAIIKGDVHGSVEAIKSALEKIGNDDIRVNVIHASAGAIVESDVNLAAASNAVVIGFHVRPTPKAQGLADKEKVEIRKYHIIYDVIEDMKDALEGMLEPDYEEEVTGSIEVRDTFKVPKIGLIAGCYVTSGTINRNSKVHLIRDGIELHTGELSSLRRFKDDAKEVKEGFECGIGLKDYTDVKEGDIFEVYTMKEIKKKLVTK